MNWQHTPDRQSCSKSDSDWQPGTKWDKRGARSANWTRGHAEPNSSTGKSDGPVLNPGAHHERNSRIRKEGEEKRKKLYQDHKLSKKHRKNNRNRRATSSTASTIGR